MAARKPRAKKAPHSQPNAVDNDKGFHSQLHSQPNRVDQTQKNIGLDGVIGLYEKISKHRFSFVKTTEVDIRFVELLCQVKMDDQRFIDAVEALTEPKSLATICADLIEG